MKNTRCVHLALLSVALIMGTIPAPGFAQEQSSLPLPDAPAIAQTGMPLKSGDRLNLTVAGFPDLSGEQVIMADGTIQLPMVGTVAVGGLSLTQANATITEALRPYVRRPQVALSLVSLSPLRISVTGEVLRPGPQTLSPEEAEAGPVTLSDALILAGGITPNADLRHIVIRRAGAAGGTAPSSEIQVNLWQVIQQGELVADVLIYDGDEINVPSAQMNQADQHLILASTLAPDQITVQVVGEVYSPGPVEILPMAGVSEAVAAAGGPTDKAEEDSIQLFRLAATGQLEQQTFEFGEASEPLRNGDLIVVEKSTGDGILDTLGRLVPVLNPLFWLFR
jgi:polysaccharide export outer membrane protein